MTEITIDNSASQKYRQFCETAATLQANRSSPSALDAFLKAARPVVRLACLRYGRHLRMVERQDAESGIMLHLLHCIADGHTDPPLLRSVISRKAIDLLIRKRRPEIVDDSTLTEELEMGYSLEIDHKAIEFTSLVNAWEAEAPLEFGALLRAVEMDNASEIDRQLKVNGDKLRRIATKVGY